MEQGVPCPCRMRPEAAKKQPKGKGTAVCSCDRRHNISGKDNENMLFLLVEAMTVWKNSFISYYLLYGLW